MGRGELLLVSVCLSARLRSRARGMLSVQILVNIRAAPMNPGDLYNVKMGSIPYTVSSLLRCRPLPGSDSQLSSRSRMC